MAKLTPKTSCAWWTQTDTTESIRLNRDYVQYPFSDDTCGVITWSGCTVTNDACAPMKLNAGDEGYFAKASLAATYTDDRHVVGTIRFDVGLPCIMELDFTAEPLF